jgi:NAD-dependent deacetylase
MVKNIEESIGMMKNSDLLMILGSSLSVTPAAYLPMYSDSKIIIVNKGEFFTNNLKSENIEYVFDEDIDHFFEKIFK